jgi:hypothetical protein
MQLVQVFQVSDCSYLQESEIVFAGTTKMSDVAMEGGTPVIVLADTAVAQQVVPPSECTRAFYSQRSHKHLPISSKKNAQPFRSAILSVVMLFRSCTARFWARAMWLLQLLQSGQRCSERTFTNVPLLPKSSCIEGRREADLQESDDVRNDAGGGPAVRALLRLEFVHWPCHSA